MLYALSKSNFFFLAERMEDQKGDVKSDEVVGYVHNVSPVKSGGRFDFQLQTQEKTVRGVCFSPSHHKRFRKMSKISSPAKLKKFRLDTKSNSEDILMEMMFLLKNVLQILRKSRCLQL